MSKLPIVEVDRWEASHTTADASFGQAIMRGEHDNGPLVQAFARHRIAAEAKAATTITELVSALKDARNALRHSIPVFPELEKRIDALLSNTRGDTKNDKG